MRASACSSRSARARDEDSPFGSSNLPVPTISGIHFTSFNGDLRGRPTNHPNLACARARAARGLRGRETKTLRSAVQICPSRPFLEFISLHSTVIFVADPRTTPISHARERVQLEVCEGARRRLSVRQFKSARPDHFWNSFHFIQR